MAVNQSSNASSERIDMNDKAACEQWVKKLNITHEQMREAIDAVGNNASDVEMHLKGVRSTTNDEKIEKAQPSSSDKPR